MEEQLLGHAGWKNVPQKIPEIFEDLTEDVQRAYIDCKHTEVLHNPSMESTMITQMFLWKVRAMLAAVQQFQLPLSYPLVGFAWKVLLIEEVPKKIYFRFHNSDEAVEQLSQPTKFLIEEITSGVPDVDFIIRLIGDLVQVARNAGFMLTYAPRIFDDLRYVYSRDGNGEIVYEGVSLEGLWPYLLVEPEFQTPTPCSELFVSFCESFEDVVVRSFSSGVTPGLETMLSGRLYTRTRQTHDNNLLIERLLDANLIGFNAIIGYNDNVEPIPFTDRNRLKLLAEAWLKPTHVHYNELQSPTPNVVQEDWLRGATFVSKLLAQYGARAFAIFARVRAEDGHFLFPGFDVYPVARMVIRSMDFKW